MSTIDHLIVPGELKGTREDNTFQGKILPPHSGLSCYWAVGSESLIKALTQRNAAPDIGKSGKYACNGLVMRPCGEDSGSILYTVTFIYFHYQVFLFHPYLLPALLSFNKYLLCFYLMSSTEMLDVQC